MTSGNCLPPIETSNFTTETSTLQPHQPSSRSCLSSSASCTTRRTWAWAATSSAHRCATSSGWKTTTRSTLRARASTTCWTSAIRRTLTPTTSKASTRRWSGISQPGLQVSSIESTTTTSPSRAWVRQTESDPVSPVPSRLRFIVSHFSFYNWKVLHNAYTLFLRYKLLLSFIFRNSENCRFQSG